MKNRYIQIFSCLIAMLSFATFPACELDDEINFVKGNTISVTTSSISNIGSTYAVVCGEVKATSNNTVITERGVVYSTSPNPTIESDIKVSGGSGLGSFGCNLEDLLDETKYYVRAYAINGYGKVLYGEEKSFTTNRAMYENGHEYIDLGLSVKWATMNVGASKAEDYGGYYAWGETSTKSTYSWSTYKWCNGSETTLTKYNMDSSCGTVDNKTQLDLSDDAARANWGGAWRMPTEAEWTELCDQCTWTWTTQNGVKGYKVTSKNGNFIFLPVAGYLDYSSLHEAGSDGYYWSSSLDTDDPDVARYVLFNFRNVFTNIRDRYRGLSVRPVLGENESVQTTAPAVTTAVVTQITETSAVVGGNVTSDGNASVTERGVVYSTNPNPVITNLNNTIRPCGSGTGEFTYTITGLQSGTKYYVRAYAKNDVGTAYGEEMSFTTKVPATPEYVDLGLSVKWATFNVGASTPEAYGDYFAWGETKPKATYSWGSYKWCYGSKTTLTKYNTDSSYGTVDNKTQLGLNDDAAHVNWGGSWRMPTYAEWTELCDQCTWKWTTQNGVNGYKVTSKSNGNSIFLPAAGYRLNNDLHDAGSYDCYWSSSLRTDDYSTYPYYALGVYCDSSAVGRIGSYRNHGHSVRPVLGENESVQTTAPAVTTAVVTQITETSAVAGGTVTNDGNASVTERGVVYATTQNPTTADNKVSNGSGMGTFTCNLTSLQPNTTYYVRAYAVNSKGTAYGEEVSFTTNEEMVDNPPSNMVAKPFSVSAGKQVTFSQGNLQYTQSTDTWSFASTQWEMIGTDNVKGGSVTSDPTEGDKKFGDALADKIDLFGWSTNANNFGVSTSSLKNNYSGSFVDWGTNQIGADAPNTWRTLTYDEWKYLLKTRPNASSLKGVAQVNGVNGLIFLPDNWTCPSGVTFKSGFHNSNRVDYYAFYQTFTADQWSKLEAAGAVFLPAAGNRIGDSVFNVQYCGYYWSATEDNSDDAYDLFFFSNVAGMGGGGRYFGRSVRLVKDL